MPRPKLHRKISNIPHFKGFKPIGVPDDNNPVVLNLEEYEAIRLCDFELRDQLEAAGLMEVSRPTFTRIYEIARRKIAQAFVAGRAIIFEGGKVYFDSEWFLCKACGCRFNNPTGERVETCIICGLSQVEQCTGNSNPPEI